MELELTPVVASGSEEPCPGCGARVPRIVGPGHRYMTSAPGCWALHGELTARLLASPALRRAWQYSVDAYAVQHPGSPSPPTIQSVAVHLISLYAYLELERAVEDSPVVLKRASRSKGSYHWLEPPVFPGVPTVQDVAQCEDGRLEEATREWAAAAWRAWQAHHDQVRTWYRRHVAE